MPLVETSYRVRWGAMRRDPATGVYRVRGRVVNTGAPVAGPVALVVRLPQGVELVNRTGMSLFEAGIAYTILTEGNWLPGEVLEFEWHLRASNPRFFPPKVEVRAGVGAL
ncbi:MAG: hypothetical protein C4336_02810 [Armatimonadota bacterium]